MIIFSFILEGIFTNLISTRTMFFNPLFVLTSFLLVNLNDKKKYLVTCFIIGLLYDVVYLNIILNTFIFPLIGFLILYLFKIINNNNINKFLVLLLIIILYRVITYLILILSFKFDNNIIILLNSITSSFFINYIYMFIIVIFKFHIRKKYS
ncbi:MAG: rod shape-determining protein MreD [Bacilli bacterium]|nr:rod shape-determining protein MreD [Bacilli bacterium]